MKNLILLIAISLVFVNCNNKQTNKNEHKNHTTTEKVEKPKKKVLSPHTSTMAMIGDTHIHIDYSSPGVRGRIVFGGLVGYDNVWQAGAHNATWIETNKDLIINGELLQKGKYGFFTVPSKNEWTIMINKNWNQHGKDEYDAKDDVLRFKVIPQVLDQVTEHLEYKIVKTNTTTGTISLSWEKVLVAFSFKLTK